MYTFGFVLVCITVWTSVGIVAAPQPDGGGKQPILLDAELHVVEYACPVTLYEPDEGLATVVTMTQPLFAMSISASDQTAAAVAARPAPREAMLDPSPARFVMTSWS